MNDAYALIDRFLRNNLDDDDYAKYSEALDAIASVPVGEVKLVGGWDYDLDARAICLDDEVVFEATTVNHNDHGRVLDRIGVSIVNAMNGTTPPAPPEGWRPIETAPRDGRKMLLTYTNRNGKPRTVVGGWVTDDEAAETDADGVGLEAGWYERIDNWNDYYQVAIHEGDPTYWMPLPAAPQPGDKT